MRYFTDDIAYSRWLAGGEMLKPNHTPGFGELPAGKQEERGGQDRTGTGGDNIAGSGIRCGASLALFSQV